MFRFKVTSPTGSNEIPLAVLTMTFQSGRLPNSMILLTGTLSNLVSVDLLSLWELRVEEVIESFYLVNFKALAPAYRAKETPLGISAFGGGTGSFKKVSAIQSGDTAESYEFTMYLKNNMYRHSVLKIGIPSATGWIPPSTSEYLFLRCETGCRTDKIEWKSDATSYSI